jgi:hypothetical protein
VNLREKGNWCEKLSFWLLVSTFFLQRSIKKQTKLERTRLKNTPGTCYRKISCFAVGSGSRRTLKFLCKTQRTNQYGNTTIVVGNFSRTHCTNRVRVYNGKNILDLCTCIRRENIFVNNATVSTNYIFLYCYCSRRAVRINRTHIDLLLTLKR